MLKSTPPITEESVPQGSRFAIACARWNADITDRLLEGAVTTLEQAGVTEDYYTVARVPGTFELPVIATYFARTGRFEAVICLGAVIKGDTDHDRYINESVAHALQSISIETGVPVLFGVLTCNTAAQAADRAGGKHGNKGVEATEAAIEMAAVLRKLSTESF